MTTNPPAGDPNYWSRPTSGYPDPTSGYPNSGGGYPAPGYGTPGYQAPGYQPAGYPPAAPYAVAVPRNNGLATASLVVSLVGFFLCGGLVGIVGALMGHSAKRTIRTTGEAGEGMATAGIVLGWISFGLFLIGMAIVVVFIIAGIGFAANAPDTGTYPTDYPTDLPTY